MNKVSFETEQQRKQRKPLPKKRTLANTNNMGANIGGGGGDANVITRGCTQSCPQTSMCTYGC